MSEATANAFDALESIQIKNRMKKLEYDCAELQKENEQLKERCKELASRTPEWPRGYRPSRKGGSGNQKRHNDRKVH
tara:strand:+ start:7183 stop:7413 length:231 start_codon:yes stop_codon:yes gene_type:complete